MRITQFINAEPTFSEKDCRGFGWQFLILGIIKDEFTKKLGSNLAESLIQTWGLRDMEPDLLKKVIGIIYQGRIFRSMFTETALKFLEVIRDCESNKVTVSIDNYINNPFLRIESWDAGRLSNELQG